MIAQLARKQEVPSRIRECLLKIFGGAVREIRASRLIRVVDQNIDRSHTGNGCSESVGNRIVIELIETKPRVARSAGLRELTGKVNGTTFCSTRDDDRRASFC